MIAACMVSVCTVQWLQLACAAGEGRAVRRCSQGEGGRVAAAAAGTGKASRSSNVHIAGTFRLEGHPAVLKALLMLLSLLLQVSERGD